MTRSALPEGSRRESPRRGTGDLFGALPPRVVVHSRIACASLPASSTRTTRMPVSGGRTTVTAFPRCERSSSRRAPSAVPPRRRRPRGSEARSPCLRRAASPTPRGCGSPAERSQKTRYAVSWLGMPRGRGRKVLNPSSRDSPNSSMSSTVVAPHTRTDKGDHEGVVKAVLLRPVDAGILPVGEVSDGWAGRAGDLGDRTHDPPDRTRAGPRTLRCAGPEGGAVLNCPPLSSIRRTSLRSQQFRFASRRGQLLIGFRHGSAHLTRSRGRSTTRRGCWRENPPRQRDADLAIHDRGGYAVTPLGRASGVGSGQVGEVGGDPFGPVVQCAWRDVEVAVTERVATSVRATPVPRHSSRLL